MNEFEQLVEKAFDYRGDVTLQLKDGRSLVGYVFNREHQGSKRCSEPFLELMPSTSPDKVPFKYSEISTIQFTGEDTAAGKSWDEWMVKEEAKKKAAVSA
jgi:hypothetical protein